MFCLHCYAMSQLIIVREGNFVIIFNLVKTMKKKKRKERKKKRVFGLGVEIE